VKVLSHRNSIPFFYKKSETEFQKDPYERYNAVVVRQSLLHLYDEAWGNYPMQKILDFTKPFYSNQSSANILEIGCGVGRWIGEIAQNLPNANCWGIDYSYQMLKRADEFWKSGAAIHLDASNKGGPNQIKLTGVKLSNLQFGLAKAESLPFENQTQDLIHSSFLFDRLEVPLQGLNEMYRVLKPKGKMVLISPLNFSSKKHWEQFHPPIKIYHILSSIGFKILHWDDNFLIEEPIDFRGNAIHWKCIAVVVESN